MQSAPLGKLSERQPSAGFSRIFLFLIFFVGGGVTLPFSFAVSDVSVYSKGWKKKPISVYLRPLPPSVSVFPLHFRLSPPSTLMCQDSFSPLVVPPLSACAALAYEEGFLLVTTRSSHRILPLPAVSLKSSPPFISALLPPPRLPSFFFFISPYRFCRSSFQLSPLSSQLLPGDSFSAQIFAFHEYAIIKHPA